MCRCLCFLKPHQVEPVMKTDYEDVWDWRVENDNKPLWTRNPKEVAETDYNEFYKLVRVDFAAGIVMHVGMCECMRAWGPVSAMTQCTELLSSRACMEQGCL